VEPRHLGKSRPPASPQTEQQEDSGRSSGKLPIRSRPRGGMAACDATRSTGAALGSGRSLSGRGDASLFEAPALATEADFRHSLVAESLRNGQGCYCFVRRVYVELRFAVIHPTSRLPSCREICALRPVVSSYPPNFSRPKKDLAHF